MVNHKKVIDVTSSLAELSFFDKRKNVLKIDQSVKMPMREL